MKKIKLFIIILICLFVVNVKADMGPPTVIEHKAMVTNKNGAQCYSLYEGKATKEDRVIPYKTVLGIYSEIFDKSYISVSDDKVEENNCIVKFSDVSAVDQNFSLKTGGVEKITPIKAVILAGGGLNMRKGPSVTYSKITTIPQYTVVTLTYKAGTYWFYCEYNGKSGWITGIDYYFGYEGKEVLYSDTETYIYSKDKRIGTIPAHTEITDYLNFVTHVDDYEHYVIYKGIKGYVSGLHYKTDKVGKLKITKDYEVLNEYGIMEDKLRANQEFEYSMKNSIGEFYLTSKKRFVSIPKEYYEDIVKADVLVKEKGYIGEGLFGEKKVEKTEVEEPVKDVAPPVIPEEDNKMSSRDMIIIGLLAGILLALTALVIIKLVNGKKKEVKNIIKKEEKINIVTDNEIEKAREIIKREANNSEPVIEKEISLGDEISKIKVDNKNDD